MSDARGICAEIDRGVLRITLARAPLNILDLTAIQELATALAAARIVDSLKAVLFKAEGRAFSAGVAVADHFPDRVGPTVRGFNGIFQALADLEVPAVALVEGPALGGGCEIACACEWVIATPAARFGLPEISLGVFPPAAVAYLPARIGWRATAQLVLTGRIVDAEEALRIGLATQVVAPGEAAAAAEAILDDLRGKSAYTLRAACRTLRDTCGRPPPEALHSAEEAYFSRIVPSQDMLEGLRAFLEKRKPVWQNR